MTPRKTFTCPHCDAGVPAEIDALEAAAAVLACPACGVHVYLTMGKLSNFQPGGSAAAPAGEGYRADYDDGS